MVRKNAKLMTALLAVLTMMMAAASTVTGTRAQSATPAATMSGPVATAKPGQKVDFTLLPKAVGNPVFAQADSGAQEAAAELKSTGKYQFVGPDKADVQQQIEFIKSLTTQKVNVIAISANDAKAVVPALKDARGQGIKVVGWDSPPAPDGRDVFIEQVDFSTAGQVMADMALDILGANGGKFAVLSATADAANQNIWIASLKDTIKTNPKYSKLTLLDVVFGNDDATKSYTEAQGLVDKYPDMQLIMAPTTVGIAAAAKAMQDGKLCDKVKVSGLGLPDDMVSYTKNGCAPEYALWSFKNIGYLTYYTGYLLATGAIKGAAGENYMAGRMGAYTIQKDKDGGLFVLMGPFTVFNKDNVDQFVSAPASAATMSATMAATKAP